jgi:hypothetical protein
MQFQFKMVDGFVSQLFRIFSGLLLCHFFAVLRPAAVQAGINTTIFGNWLKYLLWWIIHFWGSAASDR